jgi:hypothetical protein
MRKFKLFTQSAIFTVLVSLITVTICTIPDDAIARQIRGNTRVNVNRGGGHANRTKDIKRQGNFNRNINKNTNINRNTNVNINKNIDVRRYGRHGYHGDYHYDDDGIGVGAAIAIGVAGLAVGSMVTAAALPPSCQMVGVNGLTYQRCGNTWYQPQYSGSQVNYIAVNPPQ